MAQHYPLKKEDEPVLFNMVESIKGSIISKLFQMKNFEQQTVMFKSKGLTIMKLPKDFVENPNTEVAFKIGRVNLTSITDEDESLTHQISVEVHFSNPRLKEKGVGHTAEIKNIFWVA